MLRERWGIDTAVRDAPSPPTRDGEGAADAAPAVVVAILTAAPETRAEVAGAMLGVPDVRLVDWRDARQADVVIVDVAPSRAARLRACSDLKARDAAQRVLAFDDRPDPATLRAAFDAGADGYLSQRDDLARIAVAVRTVAAGGAWIPIALLPSLLVTGGRDHGPHRIPSRLARLSPRERDVLSMLAAGATQADIAQRLYISPHTVRTHVRNLLRKTGARSRVEAVALALDCGVIEMERESS
jgi:DNA-binding NarL/FixJ family response regulator